MACFSSGRCSTGQQTLYGKASGNFVLTQALLPSRQVQFLHSDVGSLPVRFRLSIVTPWNESLSSTYVLQLCVHLRPHLPRSIKASRTLVHAPVCYKSAGNGNGNSSAPVREDVTERRAQDIPSPAKKVS